MALSHDHSHKDHGPHGHSPKDHDSRSHGEASHLSVAASNGSHGHDHSHAGHSHGAHGHPAHDHVSPTFRLDAPAWSILRSSLVERLAIAGVLVIAIWVAVIATIWSAA